MALSNGANSEQLEAQLWMAMGFVADQMIAEHDEHIRNEFDPEDDYHQMKADMLQVLKGEVGKGGAGEDGIGDTLRLFATAMAPPNRRIHEPELWKANAQNAQTGQHSLVKTYHPSYIQQRVMLQDVVKFDREYRYEDEEPRITADRSSETLWLMSAEQHCHEDSGHGGTLIGWIHQWLEVERQSNRQVCSAWCQALNFDLVPGLFPPKAQQERMRGKGGKKEEPGEESKENTSGRRRGMVSVMRSAKERSDSTGLMKLARVDGVMAEFFGAAVMVTGTLGFKHVQFLKIGPHASIAATAMLMAGLKQGAMPKLQVLHLMVNKTATNEDFQVMADGLSSPHCFKLKQLILAGSYAGEDGVRFLANALRKNKALPKLQRLDLCACGALAKGGAQISKVLDAGALQLIERLNLRRNGLGVSMSHLSKSLARPSVCQALKELLLSHNQFGPKEAKELAAAFKNDACPVLKVLDMSFNDLGNEGVEAMAKAFHYMGEGGMSLDELDFSANEITDVGARNLFQSLTGFSRGLKVLKMNTNT
jgi:hypothetical protein